MRYLEKRIMDKIKFSADKKTRLDQIVSEKTGKTRSAIKKLIEDGEILLNGKKVKAGETVKIGDEIEVNIPEPKKLDLTPEDIPIDIVFENGDYAVINKPQGLTVHAGGGTTGHTLVNALLYRLDSLSGINGVIRPGIVHRIDKDTSGLLVVAKNDFAHLSLAKQIKDKTCHRIYVALLDGELNRDSGVIDTYLGRSEKNRKEMAVKKDGDGRRAITEFEVVKRYHGYTLVRFKLQTGRTHQIRVHAKYMGHSIVGDKVYGKKSTRFDYLQGQLLHAERLELNDPKTNERKSFNAPIPDYFQKVLDELGEKK